jgi:pimeloyl-ACP methyl ester carboxylesterase
MKSYAVFALAFLPLTGCISFTPKDQVMSGRMDQGLVIVLPGIEGRSGLNEDICAGLAHGGVTGTVELYDWTTSLLTPLYNMRAYNRNHREAAEIANKIVRYKMAYPDKPVFLVGQSGGGAVAIWAVEALPKGVTVDGVILLAAALAPDYMLDTALAKSKRGIINFYSDRDWVLLGLGTTIVGTMDGEHTSSAGKTGFETPHTYGRPNAYNRLYQIPWRPQMAGSGSTGGHLSSGAPRFVAGYVAPFIRLPRWSNDVVDRVLRSESVASIDTPAKATTLPTSVSRPKP